MTIKSNWIEQVETKLLSPPRLNQLIKNKLQEEKCPLIEDIPFDANNKIVTFIYEEDEHLNSVWIYSALIDELPQPMERIRASNYFYYSKVVANNIRASYFFLPNFSYAKEDLNDLEKLAKVYSEIRKKSVPDFNNPLKQIIKDQDTPFTVSILEMPLALSKEYSKEKERVPKGTMISQNIFSQKLKTNRDYWVYLPNPYDRTLIYPLLLVFDGQMIQNSLPIVLNNLIHQQKIPPIIAVLVDSIGFKARECDFLCSEDFLSFITEELLKKIELDYSISMKNQNTILMGASLGGLFALYAALKRPDLFTKVLSNSGAFIWSKEKCNSIIERLIARHSSSKLKIYLDYGSLEMKEQVIKINKEISNLLIKNGHKVICREFPGSHDYACWEATIPLALIQLLEDN